MGLTEPVITKGADGQIKTSCHLKPYFSLCSFHPSFILFVGALVPLLSSLEEAASVAALIIPCIWGKKRRRHESSHG